MITLHAWLTRPRLPKEYDARIYKYLWHIAMAEGIMYITILIMILILKW